MRFQNLTFSSADALTLSLLLAKISSKKEISKPSKAENLLAASA
jgi:hypothetical protein